MLIVITYDEFGGLWDHVPPPKGDIFGPGTRIPAIIISPYAKRGYVDHTPNTIRPRSFDSSRRGGTCRFFRESSGETGLYWRMASRRWAI